MHHVEGERKQVKMPILMTLSFFPNLFPVDFYILIICSDWYFNCSNVLYLRNFQEQVKKALCYQKLF